jgi:hypothetical protein
MESIGNVSQMDSGFSHLFRGFMRGGFPSHGIGMCSRLPTGRVGAATNAGPTIILQRASPHLADHYLVIFGDLPPSLRQKIEILLDS